MKTEAFFINEDEIFELNDDLDVKISEFGHSKIKLLIVDNFYRYPERVRDLMLKTPTSRSPRIVGSTPIARGRITIDTHLVRDYVVDLLVQKFGFPPDQTDRLIGKNAFLTNVVRSDSPVGASDAVPHYDPHLFAAQVYLNTPDECRGGTAFYRHRATGLERFPFNKMLLDRYSEHVKPILRKHGVTTAEGLKEIIASDREYDGFITDSNEDWEMIHLVEMRYNRLTVYEGNLFHSGYIKPDWFVDHYRLAQMMFL